MKIYRRALGTFTGLLLLLWCAKLRAGAPATIPSAQFHPGFEIVGHIDSPAIPESSGIVASHKYPGVYWTHNDSGNPPVIFAITREGKLIAQFPIRAMNIDWEDIALDEQGHLYLADIGNNSHNRKQVQVYRVAEPDPRGAVKSLLPDQMWRLNYPDQPFDAESLFLIGDKGYIISKYLTGENAAIYRFDLNRDSAPQSMEKVVPLSLRAPATAADVSVDGRWLAVMTLDGPCVYRIDGDVTKAAKGFVWSAIFFDPNVEGVCFEDGVLLATTEGRRMVFFPLPSSIGPATRPIKLVVVR